MVCQRPNRDGNPRHLGAPVVAFGGGRVAVPGEPLHAGEVGARDEAFGEEAAQWGGDTGIPECLPPWYRPDIFTTPALLRPATAGVADNR